MQIVKVLKTVTYFSKQIPVLRLSPILAPSDIPSPSRRHGRRRQQLFVDNITKLRKEHIRNNMATSNDTCHTLEEVRGLIFFRKLSGCQLPVRAHFRKGLLGFSKTVGKHDVQSLCRGKCHNSGVDFPPQ